MNRSETVMLLRKVKAYCPAQAIDQYTPEAWAEALADVPFIAADEALVRICRRPLDLGRSRFIEPGHLIGEIGRIGRERLEAYGTPTPPVDLTVPADYRAWMQHAVSVIKSGQVQPGEPIPPVGSALETSRPDHNQSLWAEQDPARTTTPPNDSRAADRHTAISDGAA